jgi:hypothetical protein
MSSYVPAILRRLVVDRAANLCEYCLIHEDDTFLGCQIEHIISEKHGGLTVESNLALACVFCNRAKGTDIATVLPPDARLSRLFNPRIDRWSDHFQLNDLQLQPLTDIGRATVSLLGLNTPDRLLERQTLIRVNRFPSALAKLRME